ncbi:hypothetical protein ACWELO_36425 [Streptomyces sp. NPDC004596]
MAAPLPLAAAALVPGSHRSRRPRRVGVSARVRGVRVRGVRDGRGGPRRAAPGRVGEAVVR